MEGVGPDVSAALDECLCDCCTESHLTCDVIAFPPSSWLPRRTFCMTPERWFENLLLRISLWPRLIFKWLFPLFWSSLVAFGTVFSDFEALETSVAFIVFAISILGLLKSEALSQIYRASSSVVVTFAFGATNQLSFKHQTLVSSRIAGLQIAD